MKINLKKLILSAYFEPNMTSQSTNNNGSYINTSYISIPHNFVISEGILQDNSGNNIKIPIIFDPAASTNFIQKSLLNELGWSLESTNYSILRMNNVESAN
ncbi:hypothetical protein PIROE2DRAFT_18654 [Piromyces sp. E2]|nr:hypothetical protein PIROE2DRAFT_18654 [Piromyces sp. E2]|eukprot:OUM56640.1 hypothetical protein PIROE2DRAFT_18654 [Piromyces sp. E2]